MPSVFHVARAVFLLVAGHFDINKSEESLVLPGETVQVDLLTIDLSSVELFAGVGGSFTPNPSGPSTIDTSCR